MACAASLAVQNVIEEENLLENICIQGSYLGLSVTIHFECEHKVFKQSMIIMIGKLLQERLTGPNSLALPYTFDVRGGGGFWAVEFDFSSSDNIPEVDFKGQSFAMLVQARALENGLIVMGMVGGANLEGTKGDHIILAPAYNVTKEEIEKIVDIFVNSVEEILREFGVQ